MHPSKREKTRRRALIGSTVAALFAIPALVLPLLAGGQDQVFAEPPTGDAPAAEGFSLDALVGGASRWLSGLFDGTATVQQDPRGSEWNDVSFTAADALARLDEDPALNLAIAPDGSQAGYARDEWNHWLASDMGSGCDVRDEVLLRDAQDGSVTGRCVVTGIWHDPYTGADLTDQSELEIDHMVALAAAERSGAQGWSLTQRETYANDPLVTLAVEADANSTKGDRGPENWKPTNQGAWCSYAVRWVEVKDKYALTANAQEADALRSMLATCD